MFAELASVIQDCIVQESTDELQMIPSHVAIIMDGNGRWAQERGLPRVFGHRQGTEVVRDLVSRCTELGIRYLTLFAFSSENWRRPEPEIDAIMGLIDEFIVAEREVLNEHGVSIQVIGDLARIRPQTQLAIRETAEYLSKNQKLTLVLALSYGGRSDIVLACQKICQKVLQGDLSPSEINEERFQLELSTGSIPDPDLLIRTSGECRISNFLLWQMAYTELVFTPVFWPDFTREHFAEALREYASRQRRFGCTAQQLEQARILEGAASDRPAGSSGCL